MNVQLDCNLDRPLIRKKIFINFQIDEILIKDDFPLLLVAKSPNGKKWLFKWCDILHEEPLTERWISLEITESLLSNLKSNNLSLREVLNFPEHEFYVIETINSDIFNPVKTKKTFPEKIPSDYLPSDDITIDGTLLTKNEKRNELNLTIHINSQYIDDGRGPFAIIGIFQSNLQKYITAAYNKISGRNNSKKHFLLDSPSNLKLVAVSKGSFNMTCSSDSDPEQSKNISETLEYIKRLVNNDLDDYEVLKSKIGRDAFQFARILTQFISNLNLKVTITWNYNEIITGYLALDRRRADNFLDSSEEFNDGKDTITISLTKDEIEPLKKDVKGTGGMQDLLRTIKNKIRSDNTISLTSTEIEKIRRYGSNYGQGGFQDRLRGISKVLDRLGSSFQTV